MRERLRRLWHELTYDPVAELERAKDLLAKRLAWSEAKDHDERKAKLKLWRSDQGTESQ